MRARGLFPTWTTTFPRGSGVFCCSVGVSKLRASITVIWWSFELYFDSWKKLHFQTTSEYKHNMCVPKCGCLSYCCVLPGNQTIDDVKQRVWIESRASIFLASQLVYGWALNNFKGSAELCRLKPKHITKMVRHLVIKLHYVVLLRESLHVISRTNISDIKKPV